MFSRGACNEESCKGSCLSEMLSRMISSGGVLFSRDAFKETSCRKDAEVPSRIRHATAQMSISCRQEQHFMLKC